MCNYKATLETKRLILRLPTTDDCEAFQTWCGNPDNTRYMSFGPNTVEQTLEWLSRAKPCKDFAVVLKETGAVIGSCGIYPNGANYSGELGWVLHKDYWKQGYGTELGGELIRYGFEDLKLGRIQAPCAAVNYGSYRVMERNGMRREALFRKAFWSKLDKEWIDEAVYAILAEEYFAKKLLCVQYTDGIVYKLKAPFDFSFLSKYGKVFKVFDEQGSGNICFGIKDDDGKKYFVKFAGAPTVKYSGAAANAIERLKRAVPAYRDLAHPNLMKLVEAEDIGGGYAVVFDWVEAIHMYDPTTPDNRGFNRFDTLTLLAIYSDILSFHKHMADRGYCALDFYEDHIMWDMVNNKVIICDIDFYSKGWYEGMSGIWDTSCTWYSPEQFIDGAAIDEVSCVYTMGQTAFALFCGGARTHDKWTLSDEKFAVVSKAVNYERSLRHQSIQQLIDEWRAVR